MAGINEKIYEEVGSNYRFFLGWRHAVFAGYLIVLGATVSFSISTYKDAPELSFIYPLGAVPVGILLWMIDKRTRSLYSAVQRAGARLESPHAGSYANIEEVAFRGISPLRLALGGQFTHSFALNILFLGGSAALAVLSVWLWCHSHSQFATQKFTITGVATGTLCTVHLRRDALAITAVTTNIMERPDGYLAGRLIAADTHGVQLQMQQSTNRTVWIPTSSILFLEPMDRP